MPYLKQDFRHEINTHGLEELKDYFNSLQDSDSAGALNYIIYSLSLCRILKHGEKYDRYNTLLGAIECSKQEIYRRLLSKYEDKKIKIEGDIVHGL